MYGMTIKAKETKVRLPSQEVLEDEGWVLEEGSKFDLIFDDEGELLGAKDWVWSMLSDLNLDDGMSGILSHILSYQSQKARKGEQ